MIQCGPWASNGRDRLGVCAVQVTEPAIGAEGQPARNDPQWIRVYLRHDIAVCKTSVILLHPPLPLVGVSIVVETPCTSGQPGR